MDDDLLLHSYCLSIPIYDVYNQSVAREWVAGSKRKEPQREEPSSPARHAPLTIITLGHNYLYDNLWPVINNLQGINLSAAVLVHRNHYATGGKIIRAPASECVFSPQRTPNACHNSNAAS
jgi:hypothetical protein